MSVHVPSFGARRPASRAGRAKGRHRARRRHAARSALTALLTRMRANAWTVFTAVLVLAGAGGAVLGASEVSRSEAAKARLALHLAAADVASRLKLVLQHEEDLVVSASAFVAGSREVSGASFDRWVESVAALQRYPELQNIGLVKLVPASQLAAFRAHMQANPLRALGPLSGAPDEAFTVTPAGARPYYCFAVAGMARDPASYIPGGVDYCALAPTLISGRDSGVASYAPFDRGNVVTLGVETPVYVGGRAPAGTAARRRAFIGWLGELLVPNVVLDAARAAHPGIAVRLRYDSGARQIVFSSGSAPPRAQRSTVGFGNGWMVESFGAVPATGILSDWHALTMLIGGILLSLLFALLVLVLGTGRRRALALVNEKTRELSHQASHDALTGLPNRSLVFERAAELLARAARQEDVIVGAMFIDIDDFKDVNDSLGHAAGDELLKAVGERLRATSREQDTVGRLGGDEFVMLAELARDEAGAECAARALADRMIEALHRPVKLAEGEEPRALTASVGVAIGRYVSAETLLRDADLALYAAKAAGKDRYVLFEADPRRGGEQPRAVADRRRRRLTAGIRS